MKISLALIITVCLLSACADYQNYRIVRSQADIMEIRADCLKR